MNRRSALAARGVVLAAALLSPPHISAQAPAMVDLLVRVFDGLQEVTLDCHISVYPATSRDTALAAAPHEDGWAHVDVPAGFYDLQVARRNGDGAVALAWAERLSVLRYSDEAGQHREIINLQPGFGALLVHPPLSWASADLTWQVGVFLHSGVGRAGFAPTEADTVPRVFVLPTGRYDLAGHTGDVHVSVTDVEIPARQTRMAVLPEPR
ncbi:MAG: hypothetical protein O3A25_15120 [Acidobacteria bacterium]|nr:hypothetical protein [Acidobacteriota bacterium]